MTGSKQKIRDTVSGRMILDEATAIRCIRSSLWSTPRKLLSEEMERTPPDPRRGQRYLQRFNNQPIEAGRISGAVRRCTAGARSPHRSETLTVFDVDSVCTGAAKWLKKRPLRRPKSLSTPTHKTFLAHGADGMEEQSRQSRARRRRPARLLPQLASGRPRVTCWLPPLEFWSRRHPKNSALR
ncbi:hypothetical protein HPB50_002794 [Hyalomma asiaticum]|uniref:Uncharacterized protein n=1 Tax=Hyalomma asiaticum TaxID=266040 RepID=A0ACB7S6L2_HYAAI|nr:hypothetical protein HPB50_002794 [Hyalomma asiaticum]